MEAHVGLLTVEITVNDSVTLKDKRQVVRSLLGRVTQRYNAAAAEVGLLDSRRRALLGFSCVSNSPGHVQEMLEEILRFVQADPRGLVQDWDLEVF